MLATQNPLEHDGTYPLPEAQLDRFFFKLNIQMPAHDEWISILDRTTGTDAPKLEPVASADDLHQMRETARQVPVDRDIQDWLVRIARATHSTAENATPRIKKYIRHGASPRAAQAMLSAARVRALLDGRYHVARADIAAAALPALRHRVILSFEGEADGVTSDELISELLV